MSDDPTPITSGVPSITLPIDAFVRSIGVNRGMPLAFLVGAGASTSSGIPSAQMCIREWKSSIFLTNNPGLEDQFTEISLPSTLRRIQDWLDGQGRFPPQGSHEEYGFYIQECFPIPENRRTYFQQKVRNARPNVGYQILCHLAQENLIGSIWSTNFDGLVARAAATFNLTPIEIGIDCQERLLRFPAEGELLCISLHGDYRYDDLKNTPTELQSLENKLREALVKAAEKTSLVVSGYSGRDQSIMNTLRQAYSVPGTGILYWCGYRNTNPPEHVEALISMARASGREAYYVPTDGFDNLMRRLALHCLEDEQRKAIKHSVISLGSNDLLQREPFQLPQSSSNGLIKSNAFEIRCPEEVFQFGLKVWPSRPWPSLLEATGNRSLVVAPARGKVLALGNIQDIHGAFGENIQGKIEHSPVIDRELSYDDGAVVSLMRRAIVQAMAKSTDLKTDGNKILWYPQAKNETRYKNAMYRVHEAALISLRRIGDVQYLVLKPTLKIFDKAGKLPPIEISNAIKLRILGYQHNNKFNQAVNSWRSTLFSNKRWTKFGFPFGSESRFEFLVRSSPIFARIGLPSIGQISRLPEKLAAAY